MYKTTQSIPIIVKKNPRNGALMSITKYTLLNKIASTFLIPSTSMASIPYLLSLDLKTPKSIM
jgi:hypothetical protein